MKMEISKANCVTMCYYQLCDDCCFYSVFDKNPVNLFKLFMFCKPYCFLKRTHGFFYCLSINIKSQHHSVFGTKKNRECLTDLEG